MNWWRERLNEDDIRNISCLEIRETESRIFDAQSVYLTFKYNPFYYFFFFLKISFFGSPRILPLFSDLRNSPILDNFTWSPFIYSALNDTAARLFSSTHIPNQMIPGLVAIHLRRGDYERHCLRLAKWGSSYMGFNQFEGMVDSFSNASSINDYVEHCLPSIPQVVRRLNEVRKQYHPSPLSQVYILTNAWPSYISTLSSSLLADSWKTVSSTSDIQPFLTKEQRYVAVAVDMAVAVDKAEVFVGNGVSCHFFSPCIYIMGTQCKVFLMAHTCFLVF